MDKILTVVIPSYNVSKYLRQTLDSFLCESILTDIEVLIVDDGSKDNTADIGREYEQKYSNTFRVILKENGGHGSTINCGIQEARGQYFKVVDGDDWVNTEDFVELVSFLKTCKSDYVINNYYYVDGGTGEKTSVSFDMFDKGCEYSFQDVCTRIQLPMHSLTIRTAILKDNNIRLDEHSFYVDVEYILYPVPYVETVTFLRGYVYMYRIAQATQSVSIQGYQKHIANHMDVIRHLCDFLSKYEKSGGDAVKTRYIAERVAQMACSQSAIFSSYSLKEKQIRQQFKSFDEEIKNINFQVYELSGQFSGKLKLLRKTGFKLYGPIQIFSNWHNDNKSNF